MTENQQHDMLRRIRHMECILALLLDLHKCRNESEIAYIEAKLQAELDDQKEPNDLNPS